MRHRAGLHCSAMSEQLEIPPVFRGAAHRLEVEWHLSGVHEKGKTVRRILTEASYEWILCAQGAWQRVLDDVMSSAARSAGS